MKLYARNKYGARNENKFARLTTINVFLLFEIPLDFPIDKDSILSVEIIATGRIFIGLTVTQCQDEFASVI